MTAAASEIGNSVRRVWAGPPVYDGVSVRAMKGNDNVLDLGHSTGSAMPIIGLAASI